MRFIALTAVVGMLALSPAGSDAAPQRPAGGANQLNAVEGTLAQTLFNGEVRLHVNDFRNARDAERDAVGPSDGQKILVLVCTMSNGTHEAFNGIFDYALADNSGVVVSAESRYVEPNPPPDAPPGGAWRETVSFIVPQDYQPVKLVVTQSVKTNNGDTAKAFRLAIDPARIH